MAIKTGLLVQDTLRHSGRGCGLHTVPTGRDGVSLLGRPLLDQAPPLDLEPPGQTFSGFPQRLQQQRLLVVAHHAVALGFPLVAAGGADGVAQDEGLGLLLPQAIPAASERSEAQNLMMSLLVIYIKSDFAFGVCN